MKRTLVAAGVLVLGAFAAWLVLRGDRPVPGPVAERRPALAAPSPRADAPPRATPQGTAAPPAPAPVAEHAALRDFRTALASGDPGAVRAAAAVLRRTLRTDDAAWAAIAAALRDADADAGVRTALATVLGTVGRPDADQALLDALAAAQGAPALERAILLALGAQREPADDDEVFDLGDRPYGEQGPDGLGTTIRRAIDDPAARAALAGALAARDPETRRAAGVALRQSLAWDDALAAFETALASESEDGPASVVAEALAGRARREPAAETRERLVLGIVARAGEAAFDGTRFRLVDDLVGVPLPSAAVDCLVALLTGDQPFGVRVFALDVLAGSAEASGDAVLARVRELLVHLLETAPDPALRDAAARRLRHLPAERSSSDALVRAVGADPEWNVRYAALDTLAAIGDERLPEALDAARKDADARVRTRASEIESSKR